MNPEEKKQYLKKLAAVRDIISTSKETVSVREKAYMETAEYKAYASAKEILDDNYSLEKSLIEKIKGAALEDYLATKEKPTEKGLALRVNHILKYAQAEVELWAKQKMPELFKFDNSAFEKYAKAVADTIPVPGVQIIDDPTITIASDLSEYLLDSEEAIDSVE
jgi:hypothetical protein